MPCCLSGTEHLFCATHKSNHICYLILRTQRSSFPRDGVVTQNWSLRRIHVIKRLAWSQGAERCEALTNFSQALTGVLLLPKEWACTLCPQIQFRNNKVSGERENVKDVLTRSPTHRINGWVPLTVVFILPSLDLFPSRIFCPAQWVGGWCWLPLVSLSPGPTTPVYTSAWDVVGFPTFQCLYIQFPFPEYLSTLSPGPNSHPLLRLCPDCISWVKVKFNCPSLCLQSISYTASYSLGDTDRNYLSMSIFLRPLRFVSSQPYSSLYL